MLRSQRKQQNSVKPLSFNYKKNKKQKLLAGNNVLSKEISIFRIKFTPNTLLQLSDLGFSITFKFVTLSILNLSHILQTELSMPKGKTFVK